MIRTIILLSLLLFNSALFAQVSCDSVIKLMEENYKSIKTLKYTTTKRERVDDELVKKAIKFTVQCSPLKAALEMNDDGDKNFVLYDTEKDPESVLYIPDGFPYTNLNLDIENKWVRGDNHYSITNSGFDFIIGIIRSQYEKLDDRIQCDEVIEDGVEYFSYSADAPDFGYVEYKCDEHIEVKYLAKKLGVSAYLILQKNDDITAYDQDCYGKTLIVPNLYGRRIEILISKKHLLPYSIRIDDEKGLLTELIYTDVVVNPKLPDEFFTEDYLDDLN